MFLNIFKTANKFGNELFTICCNIQEVSNRDRRVKNSDNLLHNLPTRQMRANFMLASSLVDSLLSWCCDTARSLLYSKCGRRHVTGRWANGKWDHHDFPLLCRPLLLLVALLHSGSAPVTRRIPPAHASDLISGQYPWCRQRRGSKQN